MEKGRVLIYTRALSRMKQTFSCSLVGEKKKGEKKGKKNTRLWGLKAAKRFNYAQLLSSPQPPQPPAS